MSKAIIGEFADKYNNGALVPTPSFPYRDHIYGPLNAPHVPGTLPLPEPPVLSLKQYHSYC